VPAVEQAVRAAVAAHTEAIPAQVIPGSCMVITLTNFLKAILGHVVQINCPCWC
jgi:hypothetical protein